MISFPVREEKRHKFTENITDLLERVDFFRLDACRKLEEYRKVEMGQFLTPSPVAHLMASMMKCSSSEIYILDPGAGVGSLFAACVAELCRRHPRPELISVTAYEIDEKLSEYLPDTMRLCQKECQRLGIKFIGEVKKTDFIKASVDILHGDLFSQNYQLPKFNCIIMNPPYRKIHSESDARILLRKIGIETSNYYTGFLFSAIQLLQAGGEMVAITPRSFCNGPYFKAFRKSFLSEMSLSRIHLFESRQLAFSDDKVLQENLIFHSIKTVNKSNKIIITSGLGPEDGIVSSHEVSYEDVVHPEDFQSFIHIVPDKSGKQTAEKIKRLKMSLDDLGLTVSTGRVVDFRFKGFLRATADKDTTPLIYPTHIANGYVIWPKTNTNKSNAIIVSPETQELLIPNDNYVVIKRFSSKEEKKRIIAAVYDGNRLPGVSVAFENHLNYIHRDGRGLELSLARGLAAFLNSSLVDSYFRQFSGHTQVNASDLRSIKYPTLEQLNSIGLQITDTFPGQEEIDNIIGIEVLNMDSSKHKGEVFK